MLATAPRVMTKLRLPGPKVVKMGTINRAGEGAAGVDGAASGMARIRRGMSRKPIVPTRMAKTRPVMRSRKRPPVNLEQRAQGAMADAADADGVAAAAAVTVATGTRWPRQTTMTMQMTHPK